MRTKIIFKIILLDARSMTFPINKIIELTFISSEIISEPSRNKLSRKVLQLFEKEKNRATERFYNTKKRSSVRFLKFIHVRKKRYSRLKHSPS